MGILYKDKILELLKNKDLIIESTDERVPFDLELLKLHLTQSNYDFVQRVLCTKAN